MKIIIEEKVTNVEIEQTTQVTLIVADFGVQHLAIEKSLIDAKGDLIVGTADNTPARFPAPEADGLVPLSDSGETCGIKWGATGGGDVGCLVIWDGAGGVIKTGIKPDIIFPANLTLKEWVMYGDQSGSVVADLWHCTYDEFDNSTHPVVGDSVCAAAKITIAAAHKAKDATLTDWSKNAAVRDCWRPNIDSLSNFTRLSLLLIFERTA